MTPPKTLSAYVAAAEELAKALERVKPTITKENEDRAISIWLYNLGERCEAVAKAFRALEPPTGEEEWRDIKDAPRDGTVIVGWFPDYKIGAVIVKWDTAAWRVLWDNDTMATDPTHFKLLSAPKAV